MRVLPTFRRLFTADEIHNYFWKVAPVRGFDNGFARHQGPVAIIGMGCTPFTEHWDKSLDDLIIDAAQLTYASAGIHQDDIGAFWFGTSQSAASGSPWVAR